MKTVPVVLLCAAAAFTGGFFTGRGTSTGSPPAPEEARGPRPRPAASADPSAAPASAGDAVRPFTPGRPFVKGQALAWITGLAQDFSELEDDPVKLMEIAIQLVTMDAESGRETAEALKAMITAASAIPEGMPGHLDDSFREMGQILMVGSIFRWSQGDAKAALDFLGGTTEEMIAEEGMMMAYAMLAAKNPAAAEKSLEGLSEEQREGALNGLLTHLAGRDPAAALDLAEKHQGNFDASIVVKAVRKLAAQNPATAAERAAALFPDAVGGVMEVWLPQNAAAATAWARAQTGENLSSAMVAVLAAKTETDPAAAAVEFSALPDNGAQPYAMTAKKIAEKMAETDKAAAAAWAGALKEGPAKDSAITQVADQWIQDDAVAASSWIATLPQGATRDAAAETLISSLEESDLPAAFQWAASIGDEDSRLSAMQSSWQKWHRRDSAAARTALDSLTPEERAKMLEDE